MMDDQKKNGGGNGDKDPGLELSGGGNVTVNNGASASMQFTVTETQIAAGITFSVSGLPSGVAASFTPASLPHSTSPQHVTVKFTAATNALAAKTTVQVKAKAGTFTDSQSVSLTVVSPFGVVPGAPTLPIGASGESIESSTTQVKLAAFGRVTVPLNLQIASGVSGTISLAVTAGLPAGVTAQFSPASLAPPSQGGSMVVNLVLTAGGNVAVNTVTVTVVAKVGGAERSKLTFPLAIVAPFVSGVSPSQGTVPMFRHPGTSVTVSGGGFGPGTTVTFGADLPVAASSVAADGTSLVVTVPRTAASGTLTVKSPAGTASGPNFAVDNYRNTRGCSFENSDAFQNMVGATFSYADATALFGSKQTVLNILGVNVLGPFVNAFLAAVDALLDSNGQCFGICQTSLQFTTGKLRSAAFPQQPAGAEPGGPMGPDVWTLNGPAMTVGTNVSPTLSALIHQQHMGQFSQESIDNWVGFHIGVNSAAGLRTAILQAFTAGGQNGVGAIIALNPSLGDGHAVVAIDLVDTGGGNFDIILYNPNVEFLKGEDGDGKLRASQASGSVIHVMSDGSWTFPELTWSGSIWGITVIPWNAVPLMPTFPMPEVAAAFATGGALTGLLIAFVVGDATVTQISDAQGHKLLANGQWNTDPATRLTGVRPFAALGRLGKKMIPAFVGRRQDTLTHTITGKAGGAYGMTSMAHGVVATLSGVPTSSGASDTISIDQGRVNFTGPTNKPITVTLLGVGKASKLPRTATLKTSASAGAPVNFSFDNSAETFDYVHQGAAGNYSLELASYDTAGRATKFVAPSAPVAKGDTITIRPDWKQLAAGGGTVAIRSAAGKVTSRTLK